MFILIQFYNRKDDNFDDVVHAAIVTSQKIIELVGRDLQKLFLSNKVLLLNVAPALSYGPDAITLVLAGKEENIKRSLRQLKKICYQKEIGIEKDPVRSVPPALKGYLNDLEDNDRFEKLFTYCSKEYLNYCKEHNIKPHPEVIEAIKSQT